MRDRSEGDRERFKIMDMSPQELVSKIDSLENDRALLESKMLALQAQHDNIHTEARSHFRSLYLILIGQEGDDFLIGDKLVTLNRNCGADTGRAIVIKPLQSL